MLRALALVLVVACASVVGGCCGCGNAIGASAPPFKICDLPKLGNELGWLYADLNDVFGGVDYYDHMHNEYDTNPY